MSYEGRFVWREFMSTDVEKSVGFFKSLFDWSITEMDMGTMKYRMMAAPGCDTQGGFVQIDAQQMPGVPSHTVASVSMKDIRAAAKRVVNNGGKMLVEPVEMPDDMGGYAVAQDPQGAVFGFYQSNQPGERSEAPPKEGQFCWEEIHVADTEAAKRFYGEVVGWKVGDMGGIPLFTTGTRPQDAIASIVEAPKGTPPHWMSHVVVKDVAAIRDKAVALGGQVFVKEISVPTIGTFSVLADPTGLVFSAFQPEMPKK